MTMFATAAFDGGEINVGPDHAGCGVKHKLKVESSGYVEVTCVQCEDYLRVNDSRWTSTPLDVPLSFDEQKAHDRAEKSGKLDREKQLADAMIELSKLGSLPEAIGTALAGMLGGGQAVAGLLECPNGHGQPAGQKFCGQCAAPMHAPSAKAALPAPQKAAEPPAPAAGQKLRRLRDARLDELQSLARLNEVDPDGTRADLISRLSAAGVTNAALARLPAMAA